jgi:nitrogen-specific signal transduction histidine kinase
LLNGPVDVSTLDYSPDLYEDMARQALQGHIVHQQGRILYANRAAEMILNDGTNTLNGTSIHDHFNPDAASQLNRLAAEENNNIVELTLSHTDHLPTYVVARTRPITWNGTGATELLLLDTTRETNAEAALEGAGKLKAIGQLAAQVAHDFNNLWGVISGNLELLEMKLSTSAEAVELQYDRYLSSSNTAVSRGISLTREILSYAHMPTGKTCDVELPQTVEKIHGLIDRATGSNVEVVMRMEEDLWPILLDESELDQTILNIALNAGEAMPEGGSFTIAASNCSISEDNADSIQVSAGDWVAVAFSDTGLACRKKQKTTPLNPFSPRKKTSSAMAWA